MVTYLLKVNEVHWLAIITFVSLIDIQFRVSTRIVYMLFGRYPSAAQSSNSFHTIIYTVVYSIVLICAFIASLYVLVTEKYNDAMQKWAAGVFGAILSHALQSMRPRR